MNRWVADAFSNLNLIIFAIAVALTVGIPFGAMVGGASAYEILVTSGVSIGIAVIGVMACGLTAILTDIMHSLRSLDRSDQDRHRMERGASSLAGPSLSRIDRDLGEQSSNMGKSFSDPNTRLSAEERPRAKPYKMPKFDPP